MKIRNTYFIFIIIGTIIIVSSSLSSSCSKMNNQTGIQLDSNTLIANVWYPYMMKIHETDSGNIFSANKDTVVYKDTTIYFSQCLQQSSYTFKHDHVLTMINGCDLPPQEPVVSVWNLNSDGGMELPILSDGTFTPVMGIGNLKEVDPISFVFNSPFNSQTSIGGNGYIQSIRNIDVTFRKK